MDQNAVILSLVFVTIVGGYLLTGVFHWFSLVYFNQNLDQASKDIIRQNKMKVIFLWAFVLFKKINPIEENEGLVKGRRFTLIDFLLMGYKEKLNVVLDGFLTNTRSCYPNYTRVVAFTNEELVTVCLENEFPDFLRSFGECLDKKDVEEFFQYVIQYYLEANVIIFVERQIREGKEGRCQTAGRHRCSYPSETWVVTLKK